MWSIKLFGKCLLSYYTHFIYQLLIPDDFHSDNILSYEEIDKNNISLIGGGYFDTNNMWHIISNPKNHAKGYIFYSDSKIVGYACIAYKGGKEFHYRVMDCDAFLFDFAVVEQFRGNGYGTKILNSIAQMLKGNNLRLAVKTDNDIAISIYEKFGFDFVKKVRFIRLFKKDIPFLRV